MNELFDFLGYLVSLYEYVVIANVVLSWLIGFGVVNLQHPFVRSLWQFIQVATEPLLRPIRRFLPDMGGIDISPIILLLGCSFVRFVLIPNLKRVFA
jgi:YggT family protein